jgi:hypothetical protein
MFYHSVDFFVADFGGFWRILADFGRFWQIEADFFKIRLNPPKSATKLV